jgi:hypothetical protein
MAKALGPLAGSFPDSLARFARSPAPFGHRFASLRPPFGRPHRSGSARARTRDRPTPFHSARNPDLKSSTPCHPGEMKGRTSVAVAERLLSERANRVRICRSGAASREVERSEASNRQAGSEAIRERCYRTPGSYSSGWIPFRPATPLFPSGRLANPNPSP